MSTKFVGWEQCMKWMAAYQEEIKVKLRTHITINGKFPFGTAYIMCFLKKNKLYYSDYKTGDAQNENCIRTEL